MSTKVNIRGMAIFLRSIKRTCGVDFDTLNQALPAMLNKEDNEIISSKEFTTPEQWEMILETFGEFSKEVHKLSNSLARFAVDKEEGTITIIGNNNVIEVG